MQNTSLLSSGLYRRSRNCTLSARIACSRTIPPVRIYTSPWSKFMICLICRLVKSKNNFLKIRDKNENLANNLGMTIFAETAIQSTTQQNVSTEQNVCALMLGDENVIGAKCFFYQNSCLVAMLTKPFYLKSQRDEFLKNTQEFLSKELSLDVVATLDVDVYRKIKPDMSNEQKAEILQIARQRIK